MSSGSVIAAAEYIKRTNDDAFLGIASGGD